MIKIKRKFYECMINRYVGSDETPRYIHIISNLLLAVIGTLYQVGSGIF